jgi:hypothetical protein
MNKYNVDNKNTSIHAEVDAIRHLEKTNKRKKINIFVFRTNLKANRLLMSKPCENCMEYIYKNIYCNGYRLHKIYYTDSDGDIRFI